MGEILQIAGIILMTLVGHNLTKIFLYKQLRKINKWVFIVMGPIIISLPLIFSFSYLSLFAGITTSIGLICCIVFFDKTGITGDKLMAEDKKEEKRTIKPKAKPNRVKNMSEEEKKNQLLNK